MTGCTRPLAELLVAEPDELAGRGDTDLARHIRACPHCTASARRILAANDALREVLDVPNPANVNAVLRKARIETARPSDRRPRFAIPASIRVVAATSMVVVIAAAIELKMHHQPDRPLPSKTWIPVAEEQPVLVDAPGYNVAVIPTTDPDITIFWFYKENDDDQDMDMRGGPPAAGTGNAG